MLHFRMPSIYIVDIKRYFSLRPRNLTTKSKRHVDAKPFSRCDGTDRKYAKDFCFYSISVSWEVVRRISSNILNSSWFACRDGKKGFYKHGTQRRFSGLRSCYRSISLGEIMYESTDYFLRLSDITVCLRLSLFGTLISWFKQLYHIIV